MAHTNSRYAAGKAAPTRISAFSKVGLAVLLFLACVRADGAVIYSTFGPGFSFDTSVALSIGNAVGLPLQTVAASFSPAEGYRLSSIDFAARWVAGLNELEVYIAAGDAEPGAAIESFTFTGLGTDLNVWTATSALRPVLSAGTKYWVVLAPPGGAGDEMGWALNDQGNLGFSIRWDAGPWETRDFETPAFAVNGTTAGVPEPASIAMIGLGLAGIALSRGVRSRRKTVRR